MDTLIDLPLVLPPAAVPQGILVVFSGDDTTDPPLGIIGISPVPGDKMAVAVHDGLAGCITDIITDIIPVRLEICIDDCPAFFDQLHLCRLLFSSQGKIIRCVPDRHNQQVPLGDREPVPAGIAQGVPCDDVISVWRTERAGDFMLHFRIFNFVVQGNKCRVF